MTRNLLFSVPILALVACGDDIAGEVAGPFVGSITTSSVVATGYPVTVDAVDGDTIRISGADFSSIDVDLSRIGTQIVAVTGDTVLTYEADALDFTYSGADQVVFSGTRGGEADTDTDTDTDTDADADTDSDTDADCNIAIPATAVVASGTQDVVTDGAQIWACAGSTVSATGINITVFAESGSTTDIVGDNAAVYAKGSAEVNIIGSNASWSTEPNTNISFLGTGSTETACATVTFDTSAVGMGCP